METMENFEKSFTESLPGTDRDRNGAAQYDEHLKFTVATVLARLGRYDEAERLLTGLDQSKQFQIDVLDLRAKMLAQQGRFTEAQACWLQALSLDPGNQNYRKALDTLLADARGNSWFRLVAATLLLSILAFGIAAAILIGFKWNNDRYFALQQEILDSRKSFGELADTLRQITASDRELTSSIKSLSDKVNLLEQQVGQYQKVVASQTIDNSGLQQVIGSQDRLAADMSNLSRKIESLKDENTDSQQNTDDKKSEKKDGWISGFVKVLLIPVEFTVDVVKKTVQMLDPTKG